MSVTQEQKRDFLSNLEEKMKEAIEVNQIESLEEFDAGLYITNIFNHLYKNTFTDLEETEDKILRGRLWSDAYSVDSVKKYEDFVLRQIKSRD